MKRLSKKAQIAELQTKYEAASRKALNLENDLAKLKKSNQSMIQLQEKQLAIDIQILSASCSKSTDEVIRDIKEIISTLSGKMKWGV